MPQINIRGVIVPDDDKWIYDILDVTATCPSCIRAALDDANGEPITVAINSGGGHVESGQEIYTMLREYPGPALIQIHSMAASAAAVIAMARESEISPVAQLMIHNVSTQASGDYRDMEHAAEILKNTNRALAAAFVQKSGRSEAEILRLMDRETWMTAEQAVKNGFVDRIMESKTSQETQQLQLAASIDSGLLPEKALAYARAHFGSPSARKKAEAEYEFMILEGKTK